MLTFCDSPELQRNISKLIFVLLFSGLKFEFTHIVLYWFLNYWFTYKDQNVPCVLKAIPTWYKNNSFACNYYFYSIKNIDYHKLIKKFVSAFVYLSTLVTKASRLSMNIRIIYGELVKWANWIIYNL